MLVVAMFAAHAPSVSALECDGISLGGGCLFTATGGDSPDPNDGFAVTNAYDVPMWDFVKARELAALGYPISQRWVQGPFTLQAFQKVILQWDPDKGRMNYYNTLDALANRYPDVELPFVPAHRVLEEDQGASFGTIVQNHLAILEHNAAIKEHFFAESDWLNLYGLPIRYEEREVDGDPHAVQILRTQRTVFVVWNVPAPGTTVGRVTLQNVPDKVKKLSNVIIPDHAKEPVDELFPEVLSIRAISAIHALPWASPHISPLEQEAIDRLETIASLAPGLFWHLTEDRFALQIINDPEQSELRLLDLIVEMASMSWANDGLSEWEKDAVDGVLSSMFFWPGYVDLLLEQSWMNDAIDRSEGRFVRRLVWPLWQLDTQSEAPGHRRQVEQIAIELLAMPFLDSIQEYDSLSISRLQRRHPDFQEFRNVVSSLTDRGGLTDDQALIIASRPEDLDSYLDSNLMIRPEVTIQKRSISLPITGDMALILITFEDIFGGTMDMLEASVRAVEYIMQEPYPVGYAPLFVVDVDEFAGRWRRYYMQIVLSLVTDEHAAINSGFEVLVHEVAHYYWHSGPKWLTEGGAVFVTIYAEENVLPVLSYRDRRLERANRDCEFDYIADVVVNEESAHVECNYALSPIMFLDLYNGLGESGFMEAFRRLHRMTRDGISPECCGDVDSGLYYLRLAFVAEAPPETSAIAGPIIEKWYFGPHS